MWLRCKSFLPTGRFYRALVGLNQYNSEILSYCQYSTESSLHQPHVCIVGSGPAGFGIAQTLLKNHSSLLVDLYERLPVPFGLIRYGVAPDHQDVKNCINGYNITAESERFSFYGNVNVGQDISLDELCCDYHAVVLCTGAQEERKLDVHGQDCKNVFTSKQFVGWYNGVPEYQQLDIDLSGKTAVIVGVGNVALDAARMLLKPFNSILKDTDISDEAYKKLLNSNIDTIYLIGRRGPLQMACTRKELSEITDLPDTSTFIEEEHFGKLIRDAIKKKDLKRRRQQRLVSYLIKMAEASKNNVNNAKKRLMFRFLRSPSQICSDNDTVSSIKFKKYLLQGEDAFNPYISGSDLMDEMSCDLLITCIGYGNRPLDGTVPFSDGKIIQDHGRVRADAGLYASGWCSHGARGVLADSSSDSLMTGDTVLSDLDNLLLVKGKLMGSKNLLKRLESRGVKVVTWDQWKHIDEIETSSGGKLGKIREKINSYEQMLLIAHS